MKSRSSPMSVRVGAYYFDGWSGINCQADDSNEPWSKNAPTHLSRKLAYDYSEREPVWGWRNDEPAIMKKQLDLAADHGIDFFAFCWYWNEENEPYSANSIASDPKHTSLGLYLQASNKKRVKFCLLIANHAPLRIQGLDAWKTAIDVHWIPYLKDEQAVTVDSKPLIIIYDSSTVAAGALDYFQKKAKAAGLLGVSVAGCCKAGPNEGFQLSASYNTIPGYETDIPEEKDYEVLIKANKDSWSGEPNFPHIPTITIAWDKRPWDGPQSGNFGGGSKPGWHYTNCTPQRFYDYVQSAITWMDIHPQETIEERMVLLYAWNENGEGGYLMPTKGDPDAKFLKEIKKITEKQNQKTPL
jgi:hypothetical protein